MVNSRRIYNPIQKDYVTFLKTANETAGECTLVEVELSSKGGVGLHYHKTYSEKFDCLEGELKVQAGKKHTHASAREFNNSNTKCKPPLFQYISQSLQI